MATGTAMVSLPTSGMLSEVLQKAIAFAEGKLASDLGVVKDFNEITEMMECIRFGVENTEKRALHERSVGLWLTALRDILYDLEDMIDDWNKGKNPQSSYGEIYSKIKKLLKQMKISQLGTSVVPQQLGSKSSQTGPGTDKDAPVGVEFKKAAKHLVKLITTEERSQKQQHPFMVAIVGMPGIGKTTLAQKIFNDKAIERRFEKVWICVSKEYDEIELLKEILRWAKGSCGELQSTGELQKAIGEALSGRRFLLVLDDVWDSKIQELLRCYLVNGVTGNSILVTTRDRGIAKSMGACEIHEMQLLSTEDAWLLLKNSIFSTGENANEVEAFWHLGVKIIEKCDHLPLAIKAIGGVLRRKEKSPNEWQDILEDEAWSRNMGYTNNGSSHNVMNALYLSYEVLSPPLKKCFVYFSLFPEDLRFAKICQIDLWIAEDFIEGEACNSMSLAEILFEELVDRNLIQEDSRKKGKYKMHDLLMNFGQELGKEENYCGGRNSKVKPNIRRLCLIKQNAKPDYDYLKKHEKLRTLVILRSPEMVEIPKDVFNALRYLRVLDLRGTRIAALPDSVHNLVHLRLLDLSRTPIIAVPDAVGDLRNLQVLMLVSCESLETLPESCSMLQNLRTLYFTKTKVSRMPKGVRELKQVQKLMWIEEKKIEGSEPTGSTMDELGSLKLLRYLFIRRIGRVKVVEEARVAALHRKAHLKELDLHCEEPLELSESDIDNIHKVIEELKPPIGLEILRICGFFGRKWPNWMLSSVTSFHSLKIMKICCFPHCSELPALGELRQLVELEIWTAPAVRKIGVEFFMAKEAARNARPFPKLERLVFGEMSNLIECNWDGVAGENGKHAPFPRLKKLMFRDCPKLKSLWNCLRRATSLTYLYINNLSNLQGLPDLPALKELRIIDCSALKHVGHFNVLEEIYLEGEAMDALPSWLRSLTDFGSPSSMSIQKLLVRSKDSHLIHLIRRLHPELIGLDWPVIESIPYIKAYGVYGSGADGFFEYTKSPFSIRYKLQKGDTVSVSRCPRLRGHGAFPLETRCTVKQSRGLLFPETLPENMHSDWYLSIPLGFHFHLPVISKDGKEIIICYDEPYANETGFISNTGSHRHMPHTTAAGEPGISCMFHPCLNK